MPSSIVLNGTTGIANATWTTGTRPASPVAGQSGYNTTIGAMETYTGSTWSTSDLPAPSTAGNVLTSNGTSWTSATLSVAGGATSNTSMSSNVTLTSSSNRVQYLAPTVSGLSVNLPDATTLSTGGHVFAIGNAGSYSIQVKSTSGSILVTLTAGTTVLLFLTDNTSSEGKWMTEDATIDWGIGPANTVTTGYKGAAMYGPNCFGGVASIKLSSTSALIVYHGGTTNAYGTGIDIYGQVFTLSSGTLTVGSATLIYNGSTTNALGVNAGAYSSSAAMVFVSRASNIVAVPITISGTTITVGTASSGFGGTVNPADTGTPSLGGFAPLDSTNGFLCYRTSAYATSPSTFAISNIVHNGTSAPTIGTASSTISSTSVTCPDIGTLTSTTAFWSYILTGTSYIYGRVVTLNGTSAPTLGTAVTPSISAGGLTNNGYMYKVYPLSSTEVFTFGTYGAYRWTVSGTTVTYQSSTYFGVLSGTLGWMFPYAVVGSVILATSLRQSVFSSFKLIAGTDMSFKGYQTIPQSIYTDDSVPYTAGAIGLDSQYGIAYSSNGSSNTITAYLMKYIGV